jgi:hypothetical protein
MWNALSSEHEHLPNISMMVKVQYVLCNVINVGSYVVCLFC